MLVNTPEKEDEIKWKKNFASNLNDLIFEKKININKLSGIIGIDPKTLRNYCDAKSVPTAINLMKIAEYFNVTTDSLISCKVHDRIDLMLFENLLQSRRILNVHIIGPDTLFGDFPYPFRNFLRTVIEVICDDHIISRLK